MSNQYNIDTSRLLSYNDASLEYGGFFDNGSGSRDARCHVSHRIGVGIDVNGLDSGGVNLRDTNVLFTTENGRNIPLIDRLDWIVETKGDGIRVPEGYSIHYRFTQ